MTWHHGGLFAAGLLLGGACGWLVHEGRFNLSPTIADNARQGPAAPGPAVRPFASAGAACPPQAVLTAAPGGKDGQFDVLSDFTSNREVDIGAFLVIGKEAAAAGRVRDAEVAFLMSCRLAQRLAAPAQQVADAKYQLGRLYATRLAEPMAAGPEDAVSERALDLLQDSRRIFAAALGEEDEKTRLAAQALASLGKEPGNAVPPVPGAPPPTAVAAAPPARNAMGAAPANQSGAVRQKDRARPSFDCGKARSASEQLICRDPQLAQLDRELGRLHARAKRAAPDPAGFKRRGDAEWQRREATCRDRDCLLAWYAQRRMQLLDELDGGPGTARR